VTLIDAHVNVLEICLKPVERNGEYIRWSCDLVRKNCETVESVDTLWFESPHGDAAYLADDDAEPFLIAALMLGMQENRALHVRGRVSKLLLQNLDEYMAFWNAMEPHLYHRVELIPHLIDSSIPSSAQHDPLATEAAMAAFSGGLDATFLAWRHHAGEAGWRSRKIGFFVMLSGFDILHDRTAHVDASMKSARETLADIGAHLKTLRTNLRKVVPVSWNHLHGTSLVACMHFFKHHARTVLIGSCEKYDDLIIPWGMSPLCDHLLSGASLRVIHDGAEFSRTEKAAAVAQWQVGRDRVRVCWGGSRPGGNCMRCEKCLRTMANFAAQDLPIPQSLGGSETLLNRRIMGIKLRTLAQEAEWRSLLAVRRAGSRPFWHRWIPVLLWFARIRRFYYARTGQGARAGIPVTNRRR